MYQYLQSLLNEFLGVEKEMDREESYKDIYETKICLYCMRFFLETMFMEKGDK